ncbi:hypothetical protein JD844_005106 [Phrynosoma platyrhinos]|uniref:MAM domain-containing protein n=1 Tax=Phrynosoma platyrhinos TaxID=52577 RepID=A0ABQ7SE83_PHRPL|nr:hypothetical protein JD844_005106 [Phrynosoma platyrhinos]
MLGARLLVLVLVLLEEFSAGPQFFVQAVFVNRCGIASQSMCDFVCDCWDCSDENQCGYQKESVALGMPFTCDFEGSTCGWEDVSTTNYRWGPVQASISTWGMEPPFDHTLGTDLGWYMTTTKQEVKPSATAHLRSPPMREAAATCEIHAWYHLWGPGLNESHHPTLTLELTNENYTVTLWRNPPSSVFPWRELVAYTGRIQGTFQVPGSSFSICRFEDGWCGWVAVPNQTFLWMRNFSLQVAQSSPERPTRDHNTNSPAGYFVYVHNQHLGLQGGSAWLVSPVLAMVNAMSCHLVFYLHLHGSNANILNIYYRTEKMMELVWTRSGDLGDYWFRQKVDFQVSELFQIVIEGRVAMGHKGSIALDNLILSPGCVKQSSNLSVLLEPEPGSSCGPDQFSCIGGTPCIGAELVCDFKADCEDGADERECGHILRLYEGPGQMLSVARATTPVLGPSGLACALEMDFIIGPQGFLALAIADESLGTCRWVWSALGNGTVVWERARVPLGARNRPFQIELMGSEDLQRSGEPSLLAVTNMAFVNCDATTALANSSGLSCNFEKGWCNWFVEQSNGFEWELSVSPSWGVDHTTGSGSAQEGVGNTDTRLHILSRLWVFGANSVFAYGLKTKLSPPFFS